MHFKSVLTPMPQLIPSKLFSDKNTKTQPLHEETEAEVRRLQNQRRPSEDLAAKIWSAAQKPAAPLIFLSMELTSLQTGGND